MTKYDIKKTAGVGVLSLGLVLGISGFAGASSGVLNETGPDSNNQISHESRVELDVENDNTIDLRNRETQRSRSGSATVRNSTTGGSARSGSATNSSVVDAWVELENTQAVSDLEGLVDGGMGSDTARIEFTGPDSNNQVSFDKEVEVDITNDNNVDIDNAVDQTSRSGNATVRNNTRGGDAQSGNVSNTSSSTFTVSISN